MRGGTVAIAVTLVAVAGCDLAASGLQGPAEPPLTLDASINAVSPVADASPDATLDASVSDDADATTAEDAAAAEDAGIDAPVVPTVDACAETSGPAGIASVAPWPLPMGPTIDGNLDDWPCDGRIELTDTNAAYVNNTTHPLAAEIRVRWSAQNLYVAVHVTDTTVGGADPVNPYNNDSVEIYVSADATLNGDYDSYTHQYVTDWKGLSVDYGPPHAGAPSDTAHVGFVEAVGKAADGWTFEASLARPTLYAAAGSFAVGTNLAFDMEVNDGSGTAQVAALIVSLAPPQAACACTQSCCCGKVPDLPYCDSARIGRVTLQ